jgi:hypothetical protein
MLVVDCWIDMQKKVPGDSPGKCEARCNGSYQGMQKKVPGDSPGKWEASGSNDATAAEILHT